MPPSDPAAAGDLLNHNRVPFAKLWSPALVPKPKDWGPHIDVVGNVFGLTSGGEEDAAAKDYTPPRTYTHILRLK